MVRFPLGLPEYLIFEPRPEITYMFRKHIAVVLLRHSEDGV